MNILDQYITSKPLNQNIVDLFKGEWSSKLPDIDGESIVSGHADLFNDNRIELLNNHFPLKGKTILELGPLEGGHTYMMHHKGANKIDAIESNSRAFLKTLLVKELYHLNSVTIELGDAIEYLINNSILYDLTVASGILYHCTNPIEFIKNVCLNSKRAFVWTHYYNQSKIENYNNLKGKFSDQKQLNLGEVNIKAWQFDYLTSLEWSGFCGGANSYSLWMEKDDILDTFKHFGLNNITVFFDDETHPSGPNICFIAEKY